MPLTQKAVASSKPKVRPYDLRDGGRLGRIGLILRVYPSGRRTYFYQRKRGEPWYKIGPAGPITLEAARDKADELFRQIEKGENPKAPRSTLTLEALIEEHYRPWYKVHHKTTDSLFALASFRDAFYSKLITSITAEDVKRWRTERLGAGRKPATVNRNVAALKACFAFAVDHGYLTEQPLTGLPRLTVDQENRVRYLSDDEEQRLRAALLAREARIRAERTSANRWRAERGYEPMPDLSNLTFADHLRPMVLVAMNTGIRQGELFGLRWRDVVGDVLTVTSGRAKSRKARHVPLNKEARETLKAWKDERGEDKYVFTSPAGGQFDNVKKAWRGVLADAEIEDFRWHDLRHTFASKLAIRAVPLNTIRELLGHSDLSMTMRYAHLSPTHTRAAVELLDVV